MQAAPFFRWLNFLILPGSSVVEQVTVNHLAAGSNPARAAILPHTLPKTPCFGFFYLHIPKSLIYLANLFGENPRISLSPLFMRVRPFYLNCG